MPSRDRKLGRRPLRAPSSPPQSLLDAINEALLRAGILAGSAGVVVVFLQVVLAPGLRHFDLPSFVTMLLAAVGWTFSLAAPTYLTSSLARWRGTTRALAVVPLT